MLEGDDELIWIKPGPHPGAMSTGLSHTPRGQDCGGSGDSGN